MTLPTPILPPRLSGQSTVVRLTVERLAQAGLSPEPLLREAGLADVATADLDLPGAEDQAAFLNLAAEMLQDPSFGLHLGQDYDLRKLGLLFYLMGSSETVGEALSCFERFSSLDDPSIYGSYRISDIAVTVAVGSAEAGRCLDRHLAEFWLVSIARLVTELAAGDAVPIGVSVSQPQRDTAEVTQGAFAAPVAFAASEDRIDFEVRLADIRLPSAEPYLHASLLPHFERAVEAMRWEPAVVWARVKKAMAPRLPHRTVTLANIARDLGMSTRTLSRRLRDERKTFSGILDELRAELAIHYIRIRGLPISEIAWHLGYREASAIVAAFRRWTGMPPSQVRRSQAGGSAPSDPPSYREPMDARPGAKQR